VGLSMAPLLGLLLAFSLWHSNTCLLPFPACFACSYLPTFWLHMPAGSSAAARAYGAASLLRRRYRRKRADAACCAKLRGGAEAADGTDLQQHAADGVCWF